MKKTILHFSDIHFGGPHAPNRAEALLVEIERLKPSVVAVSGDLTQRARTDQFRQARRFLDRISTPVIVVPGNHDVPLWSVADRFLSPLEKYRRWITDDLSPIYIDESLAVMGLDTTRSFTIKGGRVDSGDLREIRARLCNLPTNLCKVIVAHHPFAQPPGFEKEDTVKGAREALIMFEDCGVEVIMTGHLHQSFVTDSKDHYSKSRRGLLLVQAGTAASLRGRGSEHMKNSFNLAEVDREWIDIRSYVYSDESNSFVPEGNYLWQRPRP